MTFGEVAEALVFYRHVQLILERGTILDLVRKIGPDNFFRLLELDRVSVVYIEQHLGTMKQVVGLSEQYSYVAFSLQGKEPRRINRKERLSNIFADVGYDKRQAGRYAERLLKAAKVKSITGDDFVPGGVLAAARSDLRDGEFIKQAIRRALRADVPDFYFEVFDLGNHFQVATDLDLKKTPAVGSDVSVATLLSSILTARADLAIASHYGGDFKTSRASSGILRVKHEDLLRRSGINSCEISEFKEIVLTDLPSIAEVLDEGARAPREFFNILSSSERFASWTSGVSPDEKLVSEYFRKATAPGWIGRLPGKSTRFVIGTVVGAINPIAGAITSLADSFVVDKVLGGWRPSHFVERKLKPFLEN